MYREGLRKNEALFTETARGHPGETTVLEGCRKVDLDRIKPAVRTPFSEEVATPVVDLQRLPSWYLAVSPRRVTMRGDSESMRFL